MASEDETQAADNHHDESEWEAHKENFRRCYMDNNMTRKDAAQYMKDVFNFDATPRQWERKIKQWGFQKYSSREDRMQQITQTGKTVYEVSKPGRRPRAHSSHNLHPHEDRNLRRFARREVSRSRSRSRSTSFTGTTRPQIKDEFPDLADNSVFGQPYNYSDSILSNDPSASGFNFPNPSTDNHSGRHMHLPYLPDQKNASFDGSPEPTTMFPVESQEWPQAQMPLMANQYEAIDNQGHMRSYSGEMLSQSSMGRRMSTPNVPYVLDENEVPLNFPLVTEPLLPPAQFNPFTGTGTNIGINPNVLNNNLLSDQQMFDDSTQTAQALLGEHDFADSLFKLDVVDVDSGPPRLGVDEDEFYPIPPVGGEFVNGQMQSFAVNTAGPLQNDIGPLVEGYIRSVHTIAMLQAGNGIEKRLAAEAHFFTNRLAIVLDNFTKSQQRAVLDVSRTCGTLRERNKHLENMLSDSLQMQQPSLPQDARPHRASLPLQPSNYGNMFQPEY